MIDSLPGEFLNNMQQLLGDEYARFLRSYAEPPVIGLRANRLKISPADLSKRLLYMLSPVPWTQDGFVVEDAVKPGKHPYHAAGLFYLQDPSAMAAGALLNPEPGDIVLDVAAAPGGKATHLAALMMNRGVLIANDPYSGRANDLANTMDRWGATNVAVTSEMPARLVERLGAIFDKVLVDAPCSGEGMFRKDARIRREWTPRLVDGYARRQDGVLHDAAELVKPGGTLVYSTCTFSVKEDEGTIARFLNHHQDFFLMDVPKQPGFCDGVTMWQDSGEKMDALKHCVRLYPHNVVGEGHFIAVMKRTADAHGMPPGVKPRQRSQRMPANARRLFAAFVENTFRQDVFAGLSLTVKGNAVYAVPASMPALDGLRVLRWGWWLGTLKKNRFEPSYALAMASKEEMVKRVFRLAAEDARTIAYLHGEGLRSPGENGWVLVTVDGFPLGWGKRVGGKLKSHAPKWFHWI